MQPLVIFSTTVGGDKPRPYGTYCRGGFYTLPANPVGFRLRNKFSFLQDAQWSGLVAQASRLHRPAKSRPTGNGECRAGARRSQGRSCQDRECVNQERSCPRDVGATGRPENHHATNAMKRNVGEADGAAMKCDACDERDGIIHNSCLITKCDACDVCDEYLKTKNQYPNTNKPPPEW